MNILLLSVGTRNLIIRYFKKAVGATGKVVATDMQPYAPAIYDADAHYIVPRITAENYIDILLDICRKEKIDAALSLIDPELSLLAKHAEAFESIGVKIIGSSYENCELAFNKMAMFRWLCDHGYHCALSYDNMGDFRRDYDAGRIAFPVMVKPVFGSASIDIGVIEDMESLEMVFSHYKGMMIQQMMKGDEIGADVYIDMISGEMVSLFTKKKILMRAGETDKAVSFKDEKLYRFIEEFCAQAGWRGQIDIDLFELDGKYFISEVNPRFGGGYPHAYACGCDHMQLIVNNINGITNPQMPYSYEDGLYMMKYVDIKVERL